MKAVIIEDEKLAAQALSTLIHEVSSEISVIATLQSIEESVEWFTLNDMPDLVFLDIHLADGSSFLIFDEIKITCPIIFTTAYDEYALKAFEVNSIDYLLKPINKEDLKRAINKYRNLKQSSASINHTIEEFITGIRYSSPVYKTHFLIPLKDKLVPLVVSIIAYIYIDNKIVKIVTFDNQSYYMDITLDDIMKTLDPVQFYRANRQFIIAHEAIKDISVWFGSKLSVNLTIPVPEKIIISKAKVSEFKAWYTRK